MDIRAKINILGNHSHFNINMLELKFIWSHFHKDWWFVTNFCAKIFYSNLCAKVFMYSKLKVFKITGWHLKMKFNILFCIGLKGICYSSNFLIKLRHMFYISIITIILSCNFYDIGWLLLCHTIRCSKFQTYWDCFL